MQIAAAVIIGSFDWWQDFLSFSLFLLLFISLFLSFVLFLCFLSLFI